jgi:hypothetical protein
MEGEIGEGKPPKKDRHGVMPFLTSVESDGLFIAKPGLNHILTRRGAPVLDSLILSRALAGENLLIGESSLGSPPKPGWVVPRAWWNKKWEVWSRRLNTSFKVVG